MLDWGQQGEVCSQRDATHFSWQVSVFKPSSICGSTEAAIAGLGTDPMAHLRYKDCQNGDRAIQFGLEPSKNRVFQNACRLTGNESMCLMEIVDYERRSVEAQA